MKASGIFCAFLISVMIISSVANNAIAETENFKVPAFAETTKILSLKEDDRVSMGYTIIWESSSEFDFRITDPLRKTILQFNGIGQRNFSFAATTTGTYILHFNNSLSHEDKMVTLNYSIQHYIMGIPQNMLLVIVIAVILVLAVAAFAVLGKPTY